jgi:hypothetical protein
VQSLFGRVAEEILKGDLAEGDVILADYSGRSSLTLTRTSAQLLLQKSREITDRIKNAEF